MQRLSLSGRFNPAQLPTKLRFACVGAVGFAMDWLVFNLMLWLQLPPLVARAVAFAAAALTTWLGNRVVTFRGRSSGSAVHQAGRYVAMVLLSLLPNFACFSLLSWLLGQQWWALQFALVAGVLAGMVSNYLLAENWVFADSSSKSVC